MKENRSLLMLILLSIVTFGIYPLFFWHGFAKDMNIICAGDGRNTAGIIKRILLSLITFGIYDLFWMYGAGDRIFINCQKRGIGNSCTGGGVLCWFIFGSFIIIGPFVALAKLINGINALAADYNRSGNRQNINVNVNIQN